MGDFSQHYHVAPLFPLPLTLLWLPVGPAAGALSPGSHRCQAKPPWAAASCHLHSPSGPRRRDWCPQPEAASFVMEESSPKSTIPWTCAIESSLLVWEWAHTHSHPHAETPVTFLSQSSGPELPCAPEFFSGSGETSLSIFIPRAGIGTKGRDYCEVGWEAWLNQKSWVRKNSSQLHFHTEALGNKPPAGKITSVQATWYLLQIVMCGTARWPSRPAGYSGPLRWIHFSPG